MESTTTDTKKPKRQKVVYGGIADIAHIFANEPGRNVKCRNAFVENNVIYSYGRHFPMAKRHVDAKGNTTIFFTLRSYSHTTAKHIAVVDRATKHLNKLYMCYVPIYDTVDHGANIGYWVTGIKTNLATFKTARERKSWELQGALSKARQLQKYIDFFKIKPTKEVKALLKEVHDDKWNEEIIAFNQKKAERLLDPKLKEKREKARLARERAEIKKNEEQIQKWRNFEPYVYRPYSYKHSHNLPDLLRYNVEKQRIQTSQNVEIPVEVAHKFYRYIQVMLKKGGCTSEACCDYSLLDKYQVREITNVHIVVGCHRIKQEEVNNMAKQLNWI